MSRSKDKLLPCVVCKEVETYRRVDGRPVCTDCFLVDADANGARAKDYGAFKIPTENSGDKLQRELRAYKLREEARARKLRLEVRERERKLKLKEDARAKRERLKARERKRIQKRRDRAKLERLRLKAKRDRFKKASRFSTPCAGVRGGLTLHR